VASEKFAGQLQVAFPRTVEQVPPFLQYPSVHVEVGHFAATHFLLSLSLVGQGTPPFFSLFMIFLIRNVLPLQQFFEHGVQGDHPVTMQSLLFFTGHLGSLHLLHFISE